MAGLTSPTERVAKTIKLFIGGEFPRTESGRTVSIYAAKGKRLYAHLCLSSRKDLRNAVTAAKSAQPGWEAKSAYNRSQILYRMAEMMEGKRPEMVEILTETVGLSGKAAEGHVTAAIGALVYYSGFADKYQQLLGAVNPVAGPHHNFTTCEPVGVVGLLSAEKMSLQRLVSYIAAAVVSGNAIVVVIPAHGGALLAPLAEVFATSDLPKGVINLLTGSVAELYPHMAQHMEVQTVSYQGDDAEAFAKIQTMAAGNLKRVVTPTEETTSLKLLLEFVEYKTVWHPIGN